MANPYTRQSSFTDGDTITSALFNDEYDKLVLSFSSTVGHTHDGSTAEGAPITKLGPTQDVVIAAGSMLPKTNNTVDLGSSSLKFKDGYFAGNVTVDGVVTHSGNMIIGDAATDTLTINATIQGSSLIFEGATANAHELTLAIPDAASDITVTLPNATDTLVGKATTDVLTNKTLTSPVINTGVSGSAILDSDTMSGASATTLSSSESIKAYVDAAILTEDTLAELNDTNITSAADASLLLYDTTTSTWRDAAMSGDATIGDTGVITIAASAVDIAHLSATGTAGATNFLRGDNSWVVPTDTNTNQLTTFTVSATTDTTPTTISQGDDLMIAAGTGITTETTADGTVTITNSSSSVVSDTSPQLGGDLDANGNQIQWSQGADVASATALAVLTDGNYFDVTGTTTITSINTTGGVGTLIKLHFDGVLVLTHDATDLILPSGANITTAAGDEAEFIEYATGKYRCTNYSKASGEAVVGGAGAGATGGGSDEVFYENGQTVTTNYELTASKNAMSAGPLTINNSIEVTVPSGAGWSVL